MGLNRADFPAPIATLTVGRIRSATDVRAYAEKRNRRMDGSDAG
jgi:hypothetical protein